MRKLPSIVLDANILVQAPLRDTLLRLAESQAFFHVRWSNGIIAEMTRTLEAKFGVGLGRIAHLERQLRKHFPEAWVEDFDSLIPPLGNDRKDRHVLAAAIKAHATTIVTYNLRHFLLEHTEPWDVTAVGPSTFLKGLYASNPELVIAILYEQASDIRRTFKEQLTVLNKVVPAFVEFICRDTAVCL